MTEKNSPDRDEKSLMEREALLNESGVGPLLKAARMRIGSDLKDISVALRIRRPYLKAIEENRYDDLPGAAYTVGFIRSYAEHLGLDSGEVVRRYKYEHLPLRGKQNLVFPTPITENRIPGLAAVLLGTLLVFFSYSFWYISTNDDFSLSGAVTSIPERFSDVIFNSHHSANMADPDGIEKSSIQESNVIETIEKKNAIEQNIESKSDLSLESVIEDTESQIKKANVYNSLVSPNQKLKVNSDKNVVLVEKKDNKKNVSDTNEIEVSSFSSSGDVSENNLDKINLGNPISSKVDKNDELGASLIHAEVGLADKVLDSTVNKINGVIKNNETANSSLSGVGRKEVKQNGVPPPLMSSLEKVVNGSEKKAQIAALKKQEEVILNDAVEISGSNSTGKIANISKVEKEIIATESVAVEPEKKVILSAPELLPIKNINRETLSLLDLKEALPSAVLENSVEIQESRVSLQNKEKKADVIGVDRRELDGKANQVVIVATGNSWIQIRDDINNRMLMTRLMQAGDEYRVPDQEGLQLLTGNAGALDIFVNGLLAPSIGGDGVVRRKVILDAAKLKSGVAVDN